MHGEYKMPGGKLVVVDLELHDDHLANVHLSGDFFLEPDGALDNINRALQGQPASATEIELARVVSSVLDSHVMMYGISPEAVAVAVRRAVNGEFEG